MPIFFYGNLAFMETMRFNVIIIVDFSLTEFAGHDFCKYSSFVFGSFNLFLQKF